jgi:hypothetical protein
VLKRSLLILFLGVFSILSLSGGEVDPWGAGEYPFTADPLKDLEIFTHRMFDQSITEEALLSDIASFPIFVFDLYVGGSCNSSLYILACSAKRYRILRYLLEKAHSVRVCLERDKVGWDILKLAISSKNITFLQVILGILLQLSDSEAERVYTFVAEGLAFSESVKEGPDWKDTQVGSEIHLLLKRNLPFFLRKVELKRASEELAYLDHIPGLDHPTEEELNRFIAGEASAELPMGRG